MKRIAFALLALMVLCGCQKSNDQLLEKLGYSLEDIEKIMTFTEETQDLFLQEYSEEFVELINTEGFEENKFSRYLRFYGRMDNELMVKLVNMEKLNENNIDRLKELYSSEYFIARNEGLYLRYLDAYDDVRSMVERINTKSYKPYYTDIETADVSKDYLVLVNKYYQLPADYEPDDLVPVDPSYGKGELREAVYNAYRELYREARELGYDLQVVSSYRSYSYQEGLYGKYLLNDSQENVDVYSARPGHSEHQSGLCLDVSIPGYSLDNFYLTEASKWLAENCFKYGFIIRYTEDKVDITGYQAEPWQIRYVGLEAAKDIYERGITFDEYYACFVE